MRPWKTSLALLVLIGVALAVTAFSRHAAADSLTWDNESGDNNWFNPVNWDLDGSPDPSDELSVLSGTPHAATPVTTDGGGSITIDGAGSTATFDQSLNVGYSGIGTLEITGGGSVHNNIGYVGRATGSTGTVTVDASSTWTNTDYLCVAREGIGTLEITGGGSVSNTDGYLGSSSGGTGTVTVGGTGSTWTTSGSLYVGGSASGAGGVGNLTTSQDGTVYVGDAASSGGWAGSLTISTSDAGGTLGGQLYVHTGSTLTHGGGAIVGHETGEHGWATVDGTDSSWSNSAELYVGYYGSGTLTVQNGGSVSNTYGCLGAGSRGTGTVTVDGTGSSWSNSQLLYVGFEGSGTLTVQNGGSVSNTYGYLGYFSSGTGTVDGTGSSWSNSARLYVGEFGSGTLTVQNGGRVSNSDGYLGYGSNGTGTVTVDGAGSSWSNSGGLYVGYDGSGTLTVQNGSSVQNAIGYIGYTSDLDNSVTVDGSGSTWTNTNYLYVGRDGTGTLEITGGGTVWDIDGYIASRSDSDGTVTVDGAGSEWNNTGNLYVGGNDTDPGGTGTLTVRNDGTVNVANTLQVWHSGTVQLLGSQINTGSFIVQYIDPSTHADFIHNDGTLTVDGGTFNPGTANYTIDGADSDDLPTLKLTGGAMCDLTVGQMRVGSNYAGALEIRSGSSVINGIGYVGYTSDLDNRVTVDGTGATGTPSTWTNTSYLCVARIGTGTLEITGGGRVEDPDGYIASQVGSDGTVMVEGTGATGTASTWDNSGVLVVGGSGTGELTITAGGSVLTGTRGYIALEGGSTGTATISGTDSAWTVADWLCVGGSETAGGGTGTLTVQSGGTVGVGATLKVQGKGAVHLEAGSISAGSVSLLGTLSGSGTLDAPLTVEAGGTVSPGTSTGILNTGNVTFSADSTLAMELAGPTPGSGHDQLNVTGTVGLGGASLDCSLGYAPARGDRFVIISNDLDDIISGEFAGLPDDSSFRVEGYLLRIDYQGGDGNDVALSVPFAEVTKRDIFYNNSAFDATDDNLAVATDKVALRPGDPQATFDNYTSYSRGINGIIIEMEYLLDGVTPDSSDFEFTVGNDDTPGDWDEAPLPEISFDEGEGYTDRVTLIWDDYQIRNTWLEVTVLATGLGMEFDDTFYFGNAVGEACHSSADAEVNDVDVLLAQDNPHNFFSPAEVTCPYDYNRDGRVNATDMLISRSNPTDSSTALSLITVPEIEGTGHSAAVPEPSALALLSMGALALLTYAWRKRRCR